LTPFERVLNFGRAALVRSPAPAKKVTGFAAYRRWQANRGRQDFAQPYRGRIDRIDAQLDPARVQGGGAPEHHDPE
jgi:hypothetical protein